MIDAPERQTTRRYGFCPLNSSIHPYAYLPNFFGLDKTKEKRSLVKAGTHFHGRYLKLEVENAGKVQANYPIIKRTNAVIP